MFIFVVLFIDIMFILGLIAYFVALCTGNLPFSSEIIYNTSFWSVVVAVVSFVLALNAFLFSWKASRPDIKIYGKKFDNKLLKPWIKVKYQKKDYFCLGLSFVNYSPTSASIKDFRFVQFGFFQKKFPWIIKFVSDNPVQMDELLKRKELSHIHNLKPAKNRITINSYDGNDLRFVFKPTKKKFILFNFFVAKIAGKKRIMFMPSNKQTAELNCDVKSNRTNGQRNSKKKKNKSTKPSVLTNSQSQARK